MQLLLLILGKRVINIPLRNLAGAGVAYKLACALFAS